MTLNTSEVNAPGNNVGAAVVPVYICGPKVANPSVQDARVAPLKQISNPPPFVPLKNRMKVGVIATGKLFREKLMKTRSRTRRCRRRKLRGCCPPGRRMPMLRLALRMRYSGSMPKTCRYRCTRLWPHEQVPSREQKQATTASPYFSSNFSLIAPKIAVKYQF
jgi:hypothetical protein